MKEIQSATTATPTTVQATLTSEQARKRVRKGTKVLWPYRGRVEEGDVLYVDGKTIALIWLEGHSTRNDDITADDILAVFDNNGPAMELDIWSGRGHLTEAGARWKDASPAPQ